jgi:3-methyladenine DNA glycosylase AlkD
MAELPEARTLAAEIDAEIRGLGRQYTQEVRDVRRRYSQKLRAASPAFVLEMALTLLEEHSQRWVAYEIVRAHRAAFGSLGASELERFGRGIDSWWTADAFARTLSGPAWLNGQVDDALIVRWTRSADLWWRRAALVSTVALNVRSQGGMGDVERTLAICRLLVADREDMVVKAMSWALRALAVPEPQAVQAFLEQHASGLASRVRREVGNKLRTGLKTPRRR